MFDSTRLAVQNQQAGIIAIRSRELRNQLIRQFKLKLAEFEGKSSDDCIYEVPRKENKIERLETDADYMQLSSASMSRNQDVADTIIEKINELVDAVNELKGANQ